MQAPPHSKYKTAEQRLQPYLHDIFNWTKRNDLKLNPDKSTATLFTSDKHEHNETLDLSINNIIIPTVKHPKILGLTLDTSLSFGEHAKVTKGKAESTLKVLKALTSTGWGKQKETLLATYKTIVLQSLNTLALSGLQTWQNQILNNFNQLKTVH